MMFFSLGREAMEVKMNIGRWFFFGLSQLLVLVGPQKVNDVKLY